MYRTDKVMQINNNERKRKILVVDDMPNNLRILENFLLKNDYDVYCVDNGAGALEIARKVNPDLILLDVMMPDMDGYDTCLKIRESSQLSDIPVIFLTAKSQQNDILHAFEVGGNDYVVKPFFFQEVLHRIRVQVENKLLREQLYNLSMKDALTGLWNRRYFMEAAKSEFIRAQRYKRDLCVAIGDIDDFKKINDNYGHCTGDSIITMVSDIMMSELRSCDCVCRWGGEEFAFLLPETDKSDSAVVIERIRQKISEKTLENAGFEIGVTMSFGLSGIYETGDSEVSFDILYRIADKRMYSAKTTGKNRVVFEEE